MQGGKNGQGPNLWSLIGRQSGTVDGFAYSAANKNSGIVWSEKHLEVYLQDPKKVLILDEFPLQNLTSDAFFGLHSVHARDENDFCWHQEG
jgi:cytochrome c2